MKTKIATTIIAALAVVSICLADSDSSSPTPGARPLGTLEGVQAEVQKTQAELQHALARIAVLESQVNSLQKANAKLEKAIQGSGEPRLVPLEHK